MKRAGPSEDGAATGQPRGEPRPAKRLLLFEFTPEERRDQDTRLQPVIDDAWADPAGVASWRKRPEIQRMHRRWARSYRIEGTEAWTEYVEMVLAMARSQAGDFAPVDFWPANPALAALDRDGEEGFTQVVETQRIVAGVFSFDHMRANKQYALLLAHLIWCPDDITDAGQIITPPYPWPCVLVRRDPAEPYRLERQEDIAGDIQWRLAETFEKDLFKEARQARPLARGESLAAMAKAGERKDQRLRAGEVAYRLRERGFKVDAIADHPEFQDALTAPDGAMVGKPGEGNGVWRYIDLYRKTHNLPRPRPR